MGVCFCGESAMILNHFKRKKWCCRAGVRDLPRALETCQYPPLSYNHRFQDILTSSVSSSISGQTPDYNAQLFLHPLPALISSNLTSRPLSPNSHSCPQCDVKVKP